MKLGFYYHVPAAKKDGKLFLPGYLAVFINALAVEVEELILFMHEAKGKDFEDANYPLSANIRLITLGVITPAWNRFIFPSRILKKLDEEAGKCDLILVRAPSPLAPEFFFRFGNRTKIAYLVVGDYSIGAKFLFQPWYRKIPITFFLKRNDRSLTYALKKTHIIVNSRELFIKYEGFKNLKEIKTTTLTRNDFFLREDTCNSDEINLIYTGRIDWAKGLGEILNAMALLKDYNLKFHIVGLEPKSSKVVTTGLMEKAKKLDLEDMLVFHTMKKVGEELNSMYRMADLFLIPSYQEGFPRTIWEAMSNSLPVICSSVGSIPFYLKDREDCIMIPPKDTGALAKAIQTVIEDSSLRKKIIKNGYELATTNTVDIQAKNIIAFLTNNL